MVNILPLVKVMNFSLFARAIPSIRSSLVYPAALRQVGHACMITPDSRSFSICSREEGWQNESDSKCFHHGWFGLGLTEVQPNIIIKADPLKFTGFRYS